MRNWSKISHFAKMVKLYFVYFDKFSQKIAFNFKFRFFPFLFRIFSLNRLKWNFAKKKFAFFGSEMRKNGKISRNKKCKNRNSKTNAIILRKFIKIDKICTATIPTVRCSMKFILTVVKCLNFFVFFLEFPRNIPAEERSRHSCRYPS